MKKEYKLKTAFDIGYELKDVSLGGKKITRNIEGFSTTMNFKLGICEITINNLTKLYKMKHIDKKYRDIDFERMKLDFEYKLQALENIEYILNKIEKTIIKKYYDTNEEMIEYNTDDLDECGKLCIY